MNANGLRNVITKLPEHGAYSQKLEAHKRLAINRIPWYKSQQEHWVGWLKEYDGPGFYNRKNHTGRDAKYIYNHIMCSPMLLYLPEVMGVSIELIRNAYDAVIKASEPKMAKQCGVIRGIIPFEVVAVRLVKR